VNSSAAITPTITPALPDRVCCYITLPPLLSSFACPLTVFPFNPRSFRICFLFLLTFFVLYFSVSDSGTPNPHRMSRQQRYPAPPSRGINPFANAEPIYETGPPIIQPRRDHQSSLHSPRDNSSTQDELNPFRNPQMTQTGTIPLVAPRPSYATNISALTLNYPSPVATPTGSHGDPFDRECPAITAPKKPTPTAAPYHPYCASFRPSQENVGH